MSWSVAENTECIDPYAKALDAPCPKPIEKIPRWVVSQQQMDTSRLGRKAVLSQWTMPEASETKERESTEPAAKLDVPGASDFTKSFPDDPQLRALVIAFENGNYALVRKLAPALAQSTQDKEVAKAALEVRRRIEADPLSVKIVIGVVVLLVLLASWAYLSQA